MKYFSSLEVQILISIIHLSRLSDLSGNKYDDNLLEKIDYLKLGTLASEHHLRPWLYNFYKQLQNGVVPTKVIEVYERLDNQIRFQQLKHIGEFFRIKERLDEEEISIIPFKGFRLAEEYYGDITLRESSDLDILINKSDIQRIVFFTSELEYSTEPGYNARGLPLSKLLSFYPEYNMDIWENGRRICHVEFHWAMGAPPIRIECSLEEMQPFMIEAIFQGKKYTCFTPGGDLLMAAFHHGGKEEWTRLGHILDIGMILQKFPQADYQNAIEWAEARSISRIVLIGIQLAHQLCDIPIPESIRKKANAPEIRALANNRIEKIYHLANKKSNIPFRLNSTLYHLLSRDTLTARLSLALKYINHFFRRALLKLIRSLSPA